MSSKVIDRSMGYVKATKPPSRLAERILRRVGRESLVAQVLSPRVRLERKLTRQVIARLPRAEIAAIAAKYQHSSPGQAESFINHANTIKYLDADRWISDSVQRALRVGLHGVPGRRVLDLGCGSGYFLFVAEHLGHKGVGLDLPDNLMYNELIETLDLERIDHCIRPFEDLPNLGEAFDLITGFMIWFNWSDTIDGWGFDEWAFFLESCRSRLARGGQAWLELNPGRKQGAYRYLPDDLALRLREIPGVNLSPNKHLLTLRGECGSSVRARSRVVTSGTVPGLCVH